MKKAIIVLAAVVFCIGAFIIVEDDSKSITNIAEEKSEKEFIKWAEFNASLEALETAYELDVSTYGSELHYNWIELLAYAAAKNGGSFNSASVKYINDIADRQKRGEKLSDITKDMKYYSYYRQVYEAVLGGMVGTFKLKSKNEKWEEKYGLKCYSPIGKGFDYSDYDDFGSSRSYGYSRPHLGHDMMGLIGTPIIAVESGYIEVLGWNQYGGWRIGIRSDDKKRYYYYAHLRQNRPFAEGLKEGDKVTAGDVIGYMGHTGYSSKENVNNIDEVHLHFGIELIFDESQKECNNEIWIDCYNLCRFLRRNRSEIERDESTKEWRRTICQLNYY